MEVERACESELRECSKELKVVFLDITSRQNTYYEGQSKFIPVRFTLDNSHTTTTMQYSILQIIRRAR